VAWFASTLSGKPYSFTAHAKDIYQQGQNPGDLLQKKIRHARFVTTCTGANLLYIQCALGQWLDKSCVHKVYHGLDIDRFQPVPNPSIRGSKPLQLLSVGRYVEKKGFHFLLEACAQLRQQGYQFHCRIIGEYGDQYQFLQKLQEQLGLQDCVSLDGSVTHEALPAIYQQSDIFVLPCQVLDNGDRDGIPNVLMEAMACGLAVVSSRISGIPELIESGEHGLLVEEQNSQALTEALQLLFATPDLIVQLGKQARTRICQEFDARQTNQQLKQLFEHCINHSDHREAYPCLKQI
jgi:glycosyltransferase involved in cell wall biosynthesis